MALEEVLGLVDVFLFEESGVGSPKQRRPHLLSEGVADLVAGHGCHEAADQDHRQAQGALGGEEPGGEQERVSGQEEPDQESRLGEDDEEKPDRAERDQELLGGRGTLRTGYRLNEPSSDLISRPPDAFLFSPGMKGRQ